MKTLFTCQAWSTRVPDDLENGPNGVPTTPSYEMVNIGADGVLEYYRIRSGELGQPVIEAEPDLAFDCPAHLRYEDADGNEVGPNQKIAGIVIKDRPTADAKILKRLSLTHARKQGIEIAVNGDGILVVDGVNYRLYGLMVPDKNRIFNMNAFFCPVDALTSIDQPVKVRELENLM